MRKQLWRNNAAEASVHKAQGLEVGGVEDEGAGNGTREEGVFAEVEVGEGGVGSVEEGGREGS